MALDAEGCNDNLGECEGMVGQSDGDGCIGDGDFLGGVANVGNDEHVALFGCDGGVAIDVCQGAYVGAFDSDGGTDDASVGIRDFSLDVVILLLDSGWCVKLFSCHSQWCGCRCEQHHGGEAGCRGKVLSSFVC